MLLKSGADPDITDENGETALHIACRYGHIKLVRIFLADGSSPTNQSNVKIKALLNFFFKLDFFKIGETALHIAVRYVHYQIAKELLDYVEKNSSRLDAVIFVNTPNQVNKINKFNESPLELRFF